MTRGQGTGAALVIILGLATAGCGAKATTDHGTPSGLPVPRYVTLKFDRVNARAGPGDDHRLLWVYHVRGLPVQVVAETSEWRRVCDPQGELAWVHKRTTDGRRSLMNTTGAPAPLRRSPKAQSPVAAYLNPRALVALDRCQKGWCRVKVDGVKAWAPEGELWGAGAGIQCAAVRGPTARPG